MRNKAEMEEKEVGEEEEDPEEAKRERGEGRRWIGGLFGLFSGVYNAFI